MPRWYVVHTHAQGEERALGHLARQGFEAWLPRHRRRIRHARRAVAALRPLFPRYLFVQLDLAGEPWRSVLSTVGVAAVVGAEGRPTAVPEDVIADLRSRADGAGVVELGPAHPFHRGDRLRFVAGALRDVEAILVAPTDAERVAVLLRLLGRDVRLTVPASDLAPA
ncbi:MAG: transcription termination/antitermination NusG family protein [Alphaproteobacteria bacterium]